MQVSASWINWYHSCVKFISKNDGKKSNSIHRYLRKWQSTIIKKEFDYHDLYFFNRINVTESNFRIDLPRGTTDAKLILLKDHQEIVISSLFDYEIINFWEKTNNEGRNYIIIRRRFTVNFSSKMMHSLMKLN